MSVKTEKLSVYKTKRNKKKMKKIPFWSQTHRNGILHQIQPLEERARRRRRSKKPELRRSPNQRQIKPSRHKSPALPPFQSLSVPPRIRSNPRERIKTLLPFLLSFVSLNKEAKRANNGERFG